MTMMKKILSLALAAALLLALSLPAAAAETAAATSLRLQSTEGTVTVTNQNGKTLTLRENMSLYSGYTVTTGATGYAYITLDDTKAIKVDGSSSVTIKKSGKKLEVLLNTGKLFFDVSAPLAGDESLQVRTSTMVTGIRGTAGEVALTEDNTTLINLVEGKLVLLGYNPATGQLQQYNLSAGQWAAVSEQPDGAGDAKTTVIISRLTPDRISGFVAKYIAENPQLQQRITENTDMVVEDIIRDFEEKLRREEEERLRELEKVQSRPTEPERCERLDNIRPTLPGGGSDGGSGGDPGPSVPTLNNPTPADIINAFQTQSTVNITGTVASAPLNVPAGKTLNLLAGASLAASESAPLTVEGTVTVAAGANVSNAVAPNSIPGIAVKSTNSLYISGTLENRGILQIGAANDPTDGGIEGETAGSPGKLVVRNGGTFENSGVLQIGNGDIPGLGTLQVEQGGTLIHNGADSGIIGLSDTLENRGTVVVQSGLLIVNGGANPGTLNNLGTLTIDAGGIEQYGNFTSTGTLTNNGQIQYGSGLLQLRTVAGTGTITDRTTGGPLLTVVSGADTLYANTLYNLLQYAPDQAVLKLTGNMTLDASDMPEVASDKILTLDLNGFMIDLNGNTLQNLGTLTVTDTSTEAGGTLGSEGTTYVLESSGSLTIGGKANLSNSGTTSPGTLRLTGGTFQMTGDGHVWAATGEAVVIEGTLDSFAMTGGMISGSGEEGDTEHSGILIASDAAVTSFTLTGGTVESYSYGIRDSGTGTVLHIGGTAAVRRASTIVNDGGYAVETAAATNVVLTGTARIYACGEGALAPTDVLGVWKTDAQYQIVQASDSECYITPVTLGG